MPDGAQIKEWFEGLTRNQAGAIGCAAGFIFGVITGPLMRLLLAVGVVILFGFIARHLEKKFESKLGIYGVAVAILACASLGPVQKMLGTLLGSVLNQSSKFALAILGTYLVLQLHDQLKSAN